MLLSMKSLVALVAFLACSGRIITAFVVSCKTPPTTRAFGRVTPAASERCSTTTTRIFSSSREEEIAQLEEQLRRLKEEQGESDEKEAVKSKLAEVDPRVLEKVQGKDMILTEQALYDGNFVEDQSTEGGNIVQTALAAVVAVVFLIFFAQIPIGQEDYSKYSASPSATSRTIDLGDLNTDAPKP